MSVSQALGVGRGYQDGRGTHWQGRDGRYHAMSGENSRTAVLTRAQVLDIRTRMQHPRPPSITELCAEFAVSRRAIIRVRTGATWPDVWPDQQGAADA